MIMKITQEQKDELEKQLPRIQRHWRRIAEYIGKHPSSVPTCLDDFSSEEAEKISLYLSTV